RIKKEGRIVLICFIAAFVINVLSIILYKTPWMEIVTQLGYVVVVTIGLYVLFFFLRFVWWVVLKIFKRKKTKTG
ncbi:MAG TPA: hypothetical protein DIC46_09165, partial [Porphyromonadaceae bacterium]|nr:hypothetical protein [Porphyromonadaceae bacterium]